MSSNEKNETGRDDTSFWDDLRGRIRTRKGGFVISRGTVYSLGHNLLEELMGNISYFQLLILNATGRMPDRPTADWLEDSFFCTSYPDARIWCNHMGSLAGTLKASPLAGVCSGLLASDSLMYGPRSLGFLRPVHHHGPGKEKGGDGCGGDRGAFLSDRGFSPEEIRRMLSIYMNAGITACYAEAEGRPAESFFPLRCSDVDYRGPSPRSLPPDDT